MENDPTVHVTARMCARPDKRDSLLRELTALLGPTRGEPGCLRYELYQCTGSPDEFIFIEQWQTAADLERHLRRPHVQAFIEASALLLAEPMQIAQWQRID